MRGKRLTKLQLEYLDKNITKKVSEKAHGGESSSRL